MLKLWFDLIWFPPPPPLSWHASPYGQATDDILTTLVQVLTTTQLPALVQCRERNKGSHTEKWETPGLNCSRAAVPAFGLDRWTPTHPTSNHLSCHLCALVCLVNGPDGYFTEVPAVLAWHLFPACFIQAESPAKLQRRQGQRVTADPSEEQERREVKNQVWDPHAVEVTVCLALWYQDFTS